MTTASMLPSELAQLDEICPRTVIDYPSRATLLAAVDSGDMTVEVTLVTKFEFTHVPGDTSDGIQLRVKRAGQTVSLRLEEEINFKLNGTRFFITFTGRAVDGTRYRVTIDEEEMEATYVIVD